MRRTVPLLATLLAVAGVLCAAPRAQAAPANDNFPGYTITATPYTDTTNNATASREVDEPSSCIDSYWTLWYSWTAPGAGTVVVEAADLDGGGSVAVYTGDSMKSLQQLACKQTTGYRGGPARFRIAAQSGVTYRFQVDGYVYDAGPSTFRLAGASPPGNDDLSDATTLEGPLPSIAATVDTGGATSEEGEPVCGQSDTGASIWYRYTPDVTGRLMVDGVQSDVGPALMVFEGTTYGSLSLVAQGCGTLPVRMEVQAGTTYSIRVDTTSGSVGRMVLRVQAPAPNDDFSDATDVTAPFSEAVDMSRTTSQSGEAGSCSIGRTAWYRIADTQAVLRATIHTTEPGVGVLSVRRGSSLGNLAALACQRVGSDDTASFAFEAHPDETYFIQLGTGTSSGYPTLTLDVEALPAPANDDAAGAESVTWGGEAAADTSGATADVGGPVPSCGTAVGGTTWYEVTAPTDGPMVVGTHGSSYDTVLAVYTGSAGSPTEVVCNDDHNTLQSRVVLDAVAGQSYLVQTGGYRDARGALVLHAGPDPLNDDAADATPVDGPTFTDEVVTTRATREPGELTNRCITDTSDATVWYRVDMLPGTLVADASGSDFNTTIGVWRGPDPRHLTHVACADGAAVDTGVHAGLVQPSTSVSVSVQTGGTYWVQVGGVRPYYPTSTTPPWSGTLRLSVTASAV